MDLNEARLLDLFQILSEELDSHRSRSPAVDFAVSRLSTRMRKRACITHDGLRLAAIEDFLSTNVAVGQVEVALDPFIEHNAKLFIAEAFERYNTRRDPDLFQVAFDHRHVDEYWRFGPGASNCVKGTHTVEKIIQPMSATVLAYPLVNRLRRNNAYFNGCYKPENDGITLVEGSRLTTVPKNESKERTIAIEPSGNMALQLGVGEYITDVLRSVGLDITKQQPLNKALACIGSITDGLATIDMQSASDMISIPLVQRLLPRDLFLYLMRVRSSQIEITGHGVVELNMISTMGNGFTFPLMTLIFTSLIYANRLKNGGPSRYIDWSRTAVFGDDIIVPSLEVTDLVSILEGGGFIVNHDKSYFHGPFRESCGGDYYQGADVTPFYVRSLLHDSDVYIALNKCFEWCAKMDKLLPRTLQYIASLLNGGVLFVPEWHADYAGLRVTSVDYRYKHLSVKQNRRKVDDETLKKFGVMLCCGGYIESRGSDCFYMPRPFQTRYKVRKSRLPRGYSDGRDPLSRSDRISLYVESYAFLVSP